MPIKTCSFPSCDRPLCARCLCNSHYAQRYRYGVELRPLRGLGNKAGSCSFRSCERPPIAHGLCAGHYQQQARGVPLTDLKVFGLPNDVVVDTDDPGTAWLILVDRDGGEVARSALDNDPEVLGLVAQSRWRRHRGGVGKKDYVRSHKQGALHALLCPSPVGSEVDHVDGDPLNNRRSNLRVSSHKENSQNVKQGGKNPARNVYERNGKYVVIVTKNRKQKYYGTWSTVEEAVEVAREVRAELFPFVNERRHG